MDLDIFDLRFAFLSTVMAAGEEDDDEGEDEDDDSEDENQSEEDKNNGQGRSNSRDRIKAANDEAKKHRLRAKDLAKRLRQYEKEQEQKAEKEKPEIDRLKGEVSRLQDAAKEREELKLRVMVLEKAIEYKVSGDVDFLEYKLRKQGVLKLDDEGDPPEEFEDAVKKLAKELNADSEKESVERERSDDGEKPLPPKSPKLSGRKKEKPDEMSSLARRFPALTQRAPS